MLLRRALLMRLSHRGKGCFALIFCLACHRIAYLVWVISCPRLVRRGTSTCLDSLSMLVWDHQMLVLFISFFTTMRKMFLPCAMSLTWPWFWVPRYAVNKHVLDFYALRWNKCSGLELWQISLSLSLSGLSALDFFSLMYKHWLCELIIKCLRLDIKFFLLSFSFVMVQHVVPI